MRGDVWPDQRNQGEERHQDDAGQRKPLLAARLVKGYGATNERGKRNLAHILEHLADGGTFATPAARAEAIRAAREAALADEGGRALDAALAAHGAPARPVAAQPIRWHQRAPAGARSAKSG